MDRAGMMQSRTVARPSRSPPSASRRGLRWLVRQNSTVLESCLHGWSARRQPVRAGRALSPQVPLHRSGARALHKEVWPLIERGQVRRVLHATFPLGLAAEAHRLAETGSHIGKIVLEVGSRTHPKRGSPRPRRRMAWRSSARRSQRRAYFPAGNGVPCLAGLFGGPCEAVKPSRKTSLGFHRTSEAEWAGRVDWNASRMARARTAEPSALGWSLSLCRRSRVLPSGTVCP